MNWPREFEEKLLSDPRLERGKSRFSESTAFYYEQKEIAHFQGEGIDIRLTSPGIFAFGSRIVHESVLSAAKDWVLVRLASEEDLAFAMDVIERAIKEAGNANRRPTGKTTRKVPAGRKSQALSGFGIAKALKDLENMELPRPKKKS